MKFDALSAEPRSGLERHSVNSRESRQAPVPLESAAPSHVSSHHLLRGSPGEAPWGLGPRTVEIRLQRWEGLLGTHITGRRHVPGATGRSPRRSRTGSAAQELPRSLILSALLRGDWGCGCRAVGLRATLAGPSPWDATPHVGVQILEPGPGAGWRRGGVLALNVGRSAPSGAALGLRVRRIARRRRPGRRFKKRRWAPGASAAAECLVVQRARGSLLVKAWEQGEFEAEGGGELQAEHGVVRRGRERDPRQPWTGGRKGRARERPRRVGCGSRCPPRHRAGRAVGTSPAGPLLASALTHRSED
eukprot:3685504-Alexandrium_andersonii.AAC.1